MVLCLTGTVSWGFGAFLVARSDKSEASGTCSSSLDAILGRSWPLTEFLHWDMKVAGVSQEVGFGEVIVAL
jgi:hypothetical protein